MAENMIKFLRGNVASLPQTATEGALYFTKDEGVYLGLADGSYHRYGDFIQVNAVADLPVAGAHVNCMYYCVAENILAKWDGKQWVQINKQKTLAELGGVAKSVYEAKMTALEKADSDNATAISNLSTLVGTIPEGAGADTVIAYINKKTDGIATSGNLEALASRVTAAESDIDNLQAAIGEGGSVTVAIADANKAGTDAAAAVDALEAGQVKTNKEAIEAINNETTGILAQAKSYADGKDTAIAAAKTAADAAQADVDALEAKVGTVPKDKTVVEMIADAQTAATYDDTALKGRISANETAIVTLNGTGEGSVSKQVADAVASIVADAPEAYDTLKEISDWISSHASDASAMNSQINTNKTDIANLTALVGTLPETATSNTVVGYIGEAIAALKIGDYAKAADLTAAVERIGTAEGKITKLEGKVKIIEDKNISDGANKVEASTTNGNIKIDGVETVVYTHPATHAISEVTGLQDALDAKATQTSLDTTNANVTANTNAISVINGTGDGSFAKADATLKTELQTYADQSETDAVATSKAYTESCLQWGEF